MIKMDESDKWTHGHGKTDFLRHPKKYLDIYYEIFNS